MNRSAIEFEFARVPLGNDEVDGHCEVSFDGPSGGWLIEQISVIDEYGEVLELEPRFNAYRHVRNCLYAYRGDQIADAVREARAEAA